MSTKSDLVNRSFFLGAIRGWAGLFLHYYDRANGDRERLPIKNRDQLGRVYHVSGH